VVSPPGDLGGAGAPPATRAATIGEPFSLPAAAWRWPQAVAGLALGSAPEALLYLAALIVGTTENAGGKVTAGSAAALAVGSLVLYGWQAIAAWLFSLRTAGRKLALWGFRRPTKAVFWTVPLGLVAVYAVSIAHDIVVRPEQQQIISEFPRNGLGVGLFVLVAVIMAPLFEEIVFRGFLFRGLANSWGWVWGALASSAVFGLAHLQLDVFVPLAVLGFALAWAYRQTGSLWTCIIMHALFNLIAVIAWAVTG
jgi:membrane protease YdiL (CAAX protease family)